MDRQCAKWDGAGGSVSVVDPDGAPLANAPSREAGGVFVGRLTNREWMGAERTAQRMARYGC